MGHSLYTSRQLGMFGANNSMILQNVSFMFHRNSSANCGFLGDLSFTLRLEVNFLITCLSWTVWERLQNY